MKELDWSLVLLHGVFAAVGGLVRVLNGSGERHLSITEYVAGAAIGVFCGMMMYFLCRSFGIDEYLTVVATGIGGYMGTPLLDLLAGAVKYRITRENGGSPPEGGAKA